MADPSSIAVKFTEAVEFLRRQLAIGSDEWLQILAEEGATSSAIADATVRSVTEDLAQAALEAIENGTTLEDFRAGYNRIVADRGWAYHGNEAWHSQLIWRLHTGNAYAAGRWEQAQRLEAARPGTIYGRLITAGDNRVRHTHAEMNGIVRPIGDPYWGTHWPPNGFNCRCHVQIITERDMRRYGWSVTPDGDPRLKVPPDPGWGYNPGILGARLHQLERVADRDASPPPDRAVPPLPPPKVDADGQLRLPIPPPRSPAPSPFTNAWPWPSLPRPSPFALTIDDGAEEFGLFEDEVGARDLAAQLLAGVPDAEKLTVRWRDDDIELALVARGPSSRIERNFRRDDGGGYIVEHAFFALGEQYHGGGGARRMMQQSLLAYDRLGVGSIEVHANIDVGGYAWARLGFAPEDPNGARKMLAELLMDPRIGLPKTIVEQLLAITRDADDYELLYRVATYRGPDGAPVGKRLLLGSDWYGYADLTDPAQRALLAGALGG